jgi:hypothetical protein
MLSPHLAELYAVEPRALVQAVKRNIERFPDDFMFQLSEAEFKNLKSQIVISSWGGLRRAKPYAFTLSSQQAVQMKQTRALGSGRREENRNRILSKKKNIEYPISNDEPQK